MVWLIVEPSRDSSPIQATSCHVSAYTIQHTYILHTPYNNSCYFTFPFHHHPQQRPHYSMIMQSHPHSQDEGSSELSRPSKRRKFYRKRTDPEDEDEAPTTTSSAPPSPHSMTLDQLISHHAHLTDTETQHQEKEDEPSSIAEILRQRKATSRRKGGIEFTNAHASTSSTPQTSDALVAKEHEIPADIKAVIERFAPQTGQLSDVADKHMYAFSPLTFTRPLMQRLT